MKKIRLFSAKKTKSIEGEEAELYVNFYLVLNKNYVFTFLIDAPNLSCSDRHPIKLWKHFLMMFEEEYVKYLRRYENTISKKVQGVTRKEEEALNTWEHSRGVIEVLTSNPMGAWLHRRDKRVIDGTLNKIKAEIEQLRLHKAEFLTSDNKVCIDSQAVLDIFEKYKAEGEVE